MTTKLPSACSYSVVHGFLPVEDLVEQEKGPTACVKVVCVCGGGGVIYMERERDKVNYTYGSKEKEQTKHDAVSALVTLSSLVFANSNDQKLCTALYSYESDCTCYSLRLRTGTKEHSRKNAKCI